MEATSLICSPSGFTGASSIPPLLSLQSVNQRGLLSSTVNQQRCNNINIGNRSKILSLKASLRVNMEGVGVPTSVPVRVAHELLQAGHHYLDVRTPEEFSSGHASGAINVPYMYRFGSGMTKNLKFVEEVSSRFGKYDEIIVGCQSGKRSMMAATDLLAAGFTGVTDIAGGFASWKQNGLPTKP